MKKSHVSTYVFLFLAICSRSAVLAAQAPQSVVEWIRGAAIPIATADPSAGNDDLKPLRRVVGDARIVSLGESTHGTREHFQLKHRMLRFLVEEMGFTLFGIEAGFPNCRAINAYVLGGPGDVEKVVGDNTYGAWDRREVLELVDWMRRYNADPSHPKKVKFYGFDMQEDEAALDAAVEGIEGRDREAANAIAARLRTQFGDSLFVRYREMTAAQRDTLKADVAALIALFDAGRPDVADRSRLDSWAVGRQNAVVLRQCTELLTSYVENDPPPELGSVADAYYTSAGRCKALQLYLAECRPEVAARVRPLLDDLQRPNALISRDYRKLSDERRDVFDALAAEITRVLAELRVEMGDEAGAQVLARMKAHAKVLANLLGMLRFRAQRSEHRPVVRDRCMAENVAWILEHEGPGAKIVLWSHNFHAYKEPAPPGCGYMGAELDRRFGREQVIIGFAFGRGSFRASSMSLSVFEGDRPKITPSAECRAPPSDAGSIDGTLDRAAIPIFALALRDAPKVGPAAWFHDEQLLRDVGALYVPESDVNHYYPVVPARDFDVLIFTAETTASLPNRAFRERFKLPMVLGPEVGLLPGSWRLTRIELVSANDDLSEVGRRRFEESRSKIETTTGRIRSGELTIITTFGTDSRYRHELRSKDRPEPLYAEEGSWTLDPATGVITGKPAREIESTVDGFRVRRLLRGELILRMDFQGDLEGVCETLYLERAGPK